MNETVHSARKAPKRTNDPERTMAGIIAVATAEFAAKGLAGGRIDAIADATHTSKRMIYYIRATEAELHLADLPPVEALKALVGFTFDHHHSNQDFIRLVMSENIQRGEYLAQSKLIQELNHSAIQSIEALYKRGVKDKVFRKGLDPIDIHASISALTFFNVSNRYTFDLIFKRNGQTAKALAARRESVVDMVLRFVSYSNLS
jgi:AcrR family transcriptional regulator